MCGNTSCTGPGCIYVVMSVLCVVSPHTQDVCGNEIIVLCVVTPHGYIYRTQYYLRLVNHFFLRPCSSSGPCEHSGKSSW